jgi:hypothetical protein
MKALGMLRACRESRQVIVERLPIRLPSRISTQEIRLGLHDVLSIRNIRSFLTDLQAANNYGLEIPTAIFQIPALVIFSEINGATDLDDFISIFSGYDIFPLPISVLKPFRTVVFCPEHRRQSTYDDTDCFSDHTPNFDTTLLTPEQFAIFEYTKSNEIYLKLDMNRAKEKSNNDIKIPEIKIMAKGWPVKPIEPAEESKKS